MLWLNSKGEKILHLRKDDTSACGSLNNIFTYKERDKYMTTDKNKVTCGRCKRTKYYKEYINNIDDFYEWSKYQDIKINVSDKYLDEFKKDIIDCISFILIMEQQIIDINQIQKMKQMFFDTCSYETYNEWYKENYNESNTV